ncbi:hypothetical protein [Leifsonia sp. Le1]|uniref:hypothetical protein n=1 Tax=Leifsonia sp. Le1 TaxID=3404918 RepID=UPI003EBED6F7
MPFELTHLRAGGVSVLLDHRGGLLPSIVHWGADLGDLTAQDAHAVALANVAPQTRRTACRCRRGSGQWMRGSRRTA